MGRKRQLVLFAPDEEGSSADGLGIRSAVIASLARHNTAPDGSETGTMGTVTLYGPGLIAEITTAAGDRDPINQVMVTVIDEDLAWPVLSRLCRSEAWKMMDAESGMTFG